LKPGVSSRNFGTERTVESLGISQYPSPLPENSRRGSGQILSPAKRDTDLPNGFWLVSSDCQRAELPGRLEGLQTNRYSTDCAGQSQALKSTYKCSACLRCSKLDALAQNLVAAPTLIPLFLRTVRCEHTCAGAGLRRL